MRMTGQLRNIGEIDMPCVFPWPLVEKTAGKLWSVTYAGIRLYADGPQEALEKMGQTLDLLKRLEAQERLRLFQSGRAPNSRCAPQGHLRGRNQDPLWRERKIRDLKRKAGR